jgi:urease beta subunit
MAKKGKAKKKPEKRAVIAKKTKARSLQPSGVTPGEVILGDGDIVAFNGRTTVELTVANTGDRPIQVGTAVRFEPGEEKRVTLVAIGGNRVAYGINGLVNGRLDDPLVKQKAVALAKERGFIGKGAGS